MKELRYDAEFYGWMGIVAQKGMPPEVMTRLRGALAKLVQDPGYKSVMGQIGETLAYLDSEEFARAWDLEYRKMGEVLKHIVKK